MIGVGDRILGFTLPFAVAGVAANLVWPSVFRMALGTPGRIAGIVLLATGLALYLASLIQVIVQVPRGELMTRGVYAVVAHPLYCALSLLVIPSVGLLLDTWIGFAIGGTMYVGSRLFRGREEARLAAMFPDEYPAYRARVLLPWL